MNTKTMSRTEIQNSRYPPVKSRCFLAFALAAFLLVFVLASARVAAEFPAETAPQQWEEQIHKAFKRTRSTWPEDKRRELACFLRNLIETSSFKYKSDQLETITSFIREGSTIAYQTAEGCYDDNLFELDKEWWRWRAVEAPVLRWQTSDQDRQDVLAQYDSVLTNVIGTLRKTVPELPDYFLDRYRIDNLNVLHRRLENPLELSYLVPLSQESMNLLADNVACMNDAMLQGLDRPDRVGERPRLVKALEDLKKALESGDRKKIDFAYGFLAHPGGILFRMYLFDCDPTQALCEYSRLSMPEIPARMIELCAKIAGKRVEEFAGPAAEPRVSVDIETDLYQICIQTAQKASQRVDCQGEDQTPAATSAIASPGARPQVSDASTSLGASTEERPTARKTEKTAAGEPSGCRSGSAWWLGLVVGIISILAGCFLLVSGRLKSSR